MGRSLIAIDRLQSQLLLGNALTTPHEVVSHLGAMQAQDILGSLWAIGARMRGGDESDVERAVAERKIVRCWPMRGTLHFVAAEDVRWMLSLHAPRVLKRSRTRLERDFDLDAATLRKCRTIIERALRGGHALTRSEIYAALEREKIATRDSRGLRILFAIAHEQHICFGPKRGKQPTFVLLDEWIPEPSKKTREESLAELARRYFRGHGPATAADLMWWSGLTMKEVNEAIALAGQTDGRWQMADGTTNRHLPSAIRHLSSKKAPVRLLPPFDEFTVGYKDRSAIIDPRFARYVNNGGGLLNAVVVINGRVEGTWKRTLGKTNVDITIAPFRKFSASEVSAIEREAKRYGKFVRREALVSIP